MKGLRTLVVGAALAAGVPLLTYLTGIDWTQYVPAPYAPVIGGVLMIAMRLVTTGPVGKSA